MKQLIELTSEKFSEIYTNEKFRNEVAFAHWAADRNGNNKYQKTCSYPTEYKVTPEQIEEAQKERKRAKSEVIKNNLNKLMFVGMGSTYEPSDNEDPGNYRIRTEFINKVGNKFFIEFTRYNNGLMMVDHAIDRTTEERLNGAFNKQSQYNNYKGLERTKDRLPYTKSKILDIVNNYFDCSFNEVIIDNYNTCTDDFTCISPQ